MNSYRSILILLPLLAFVGIGVLASSIYHVSPYIEPRKITLSAPVVQEALEIKEISVTPFILQPIRQIAGSFRILAQDRNRIGYRAQLAGTDLLVGWGRLADLEIAEEFTFHVDDGYYSWESSVLPVDAQEMKESVALYSVISANKTISQRLAGLRLHDLMSLSGYIVTASHRDGWSDASIEQDNSQRSDLLYVYELNYGPALENSQELSPENFLFKRRLPDSR